MFNLAMFLLPQPIATIIVGISPYVDDSKMYQLT